MSEKTKPHVNAAYDPELVYIYGKEIGAIGVIDGDATVEANVTIASAEKQATYCVLVVYGYAYDGHCYGMQKPKMMVVRKETLAGARYEAFEEECGFTSAAGYQCYEFVSSDEFAFLQMSSGSVKSMILDENLPGRRSPAVYAQTMSQSPTR